MSRLRDPTSRSKIWPISQSKQTCKSNWWLGCFYFNFAFILVLSRCNKRLWHILLSLGWKVNTIYCATLCTYFHFLSNKVIYLDRFNYFIEYRCNYFLLCLTIIKVKASRVIIVVGWLSYSCALDSGALQISF